MSQSKSSKARVAPAKRNRQNQRTFHNVKKRRAVHAKNHGHASVETMEKAMGIRRWIAPPTSKS